MARTAEETIASYVTDMLALEEHISTALQGQIADADLGPDVRAELQEVRDVCERHIRALESLADQRKQGGQGIAEGVKRAASAILGVGAAAVDLVRSEQLPKNLRDDYTALSLAVVGYVMLHSTALSLHDTRTAALALDHLTAHAQSVMAMHNIIPSAVIRFLQAEGLNADVSVLETISDNLESVWRDEGDIPQPEDDVAADGSATR